MKQRSLPASRQCARDPERLEHFDLAFPSKVRPNDGVRPRGWLSGDERCAPSIAEYNLLACSRHTHLRTSLAAMLASAKIGGLSPLPGGRKSVRRLAESLLFYCQTNRLSQ
jgi:hypothetical protein